MNAISAISSVQSTSSTEGTNRMARFKQLMEASAQYLGLSADALRTQLQAGKSLADVANSQGKSVDGLKQALQAVVSSNQNGSTDGTALLDRIINGRPGQRPPEDSQNGDGFAQLLKASASYLGVSADDLQSQLESGKSLADIATTQGKSVDGLKQALQAALPAPSSDGSGVTTATSADGGASLDQIINGHPGRHHHHRGTVESSASTGGATSASVNLVI
jgi:hypothetical protein